MPLRGGWAGMGSASLFQRPDPQEKYEQVLAGLTADGIEWRYIRCDIADHDSRLHLIEETVRQFGRIDVLVNNAASRRRCALICWR